MGQRMAADFMTVGNGLFPAVRTLFNSARRDVERHFHIGFLQQRKPCIHLAHPPVVEAQAHGGALPVGPLEGLRVRRRRQAGEAAYGETDTVHRYFPIKWTRAAARRSISKPTIPKRAWTIVRGAGHSTCTSGTGGGCRTRSRSRRC